MIVADRIRVERIERLAAIGDAAGGRVRVGFPRWLRLFLQKGVIAITLGRTVYLSERLLDRAEDDTLKIVRHELVHVQQVARLGLVRFLWIYVRDYLANRRKGMKSFEAYEAIAFEIEARAAEQPDAPTAV